MISSRLGVGEDVGRKRESVRSKKFGDRDRKKGKEVEEKKAKKEVDEILRSKEVLARFGLGW